MTERNEFANGVALALTLTPDWVASAALSPPADRLQPFLSVATVLEYLFQSDIVRTCYAAKDALLKLPSHKPAPSVICYLIQVFQRAVLGEKMAGKGFDAAASVNALWSNVCNQAPLLARLKALCDEFHL